MQKKTGPWRMHHGPVKDQENRGSGSQRRADTSHKCHSTATPIGERLIASRVQTYPSGGLAARLTSWIIRQNSPQLTSCIVSSVCSWNNGCTGSHIRSTVRMPRIPNVSRITRAVRSHSTNRLCRRTSEGAFRTGQLTKNPLYVFAKAQR